MATRIPPKEITGLRGAVVKKFSKKMLGQVPATLGVGWHNPAVLQGFFAIGGKARKWDECDLDLKSYAHMAVASLVGCTWCLDFGYFQASNENLDLEKAREILGDQRRGTGCNIAGTGPFRTPPARCYRSRVAGRRTAERHVTDYQTTGSTQA
jgi:hypothetical protein